MWRIGTKVARNLYRGDEPVAMLATGELAAEIAYTMNRVRALEDALDVAEEALQRIVTGMHGGDNDVEATAEEALEKIAKRRRSDNDF